MGRFWNSPVMRKNYARHIRNLRKDLDQWLPELTGLSPSKRDAVDAIASWEYWYRLRDIQSLSKQTSIDTIVEMLELLMLPK